MIRFFAEHDWARVLEVERKCFPRDERWSREDYQSGLDTGRLGCLVWADASDRLVGCLWWEVSRGTATVFSLGVLPRARRKGVAQELLSHLFFGGVFGMDLIPTKLQVHVENIKAQRLYYPFGFKPARFLKNYYGRGKHALEMRRP